jgi:hypothetical protein
MGKTTAMGGTMRCETDPVGQAITTCFETSQAVSAQRPQRHGENRGDSGNHQTVPNRHHITIFEQVPTDR